MKQKQILKLIMLSIALTIPTISTANTAAESSTIYGHELVVPFTHPAFIAPALTVTGGFGANPDRRRVAGSALLLQSMHMINEPSIPSNSIIPIYSSLYQNRIVATQPQPIYIFLVPVESNTSSDFNPNAIGVYQVTPHITGEPYSIK
jgi:hypothetical protein